MAVVRAVVGARSQCDLHRIRPQRKVHSELLKGSVLDSVEA
jgi:hypothetical protein